MFAYVLKFIISLGALGFFLFATVYVERKGLGEIFGSSKKFGGSLIFPQMIRLLSLGGRGVSSKDCLFAFVCLLVSFAPFMVFPLCGPFRGIFPEYFHLESAVLFVLMFQVFSQVIIFIVRKEQPGRLQEIFILREFVNYTSSKSLTLFALLPLFAIYGTLNFHDIVQKQTDTFVGFLPTLGIFLQPVSALLFLTCIQMESSSGIFNTSGELAKYSYRSVNGREVFFLELVKKSQRLSLVLLYVFIFLGGYGVLPGLGYISGKNPDFLIFLQALSLVIKVIFMIFILTIVDASFSRLRVSDVASLSLNRLVPVALINFLLTLAYFFYRGTSAWS